MKIFHISGLYSSYIDGFFLAHPEISHMTFSEALSLLDNDFMSWGGGWEDGLIKAGCEAEHVTMGVGAQQNFLLSLWAKENMPSGEYSDSDILVAMVQASRPDVVLFYCWDEQLLQRLKAECPSVRLFVGWIGSSLFNFDIMRQLDLMLCCAPENIPTLNQMGIKAVHIDHAFNPDINNFIQPGTKVGTTFVGQLVRQKSFHRQREEMLLEISRYTDLKIYSPSYYAGGFKENTKVLLRKALYYENKTLNSLTGGLAGRVIAHVPKLGKVTRWTEAPVMPVNRKLKPYLCPPKWGLAMFQALSDSLIALNIHADSSPKFASNMRLWEATGVGTCLLTDRKENMADIFVEDKECVVYDSAEDCVEKIKWLTEHPEKALEIGRAGQARTLRDHTNVQQGDRIVQAVRAML